MSTKVIRFPRFTEPHNRGENVQAQWLEITDRLNKFKAQLEQEFANVYAAIPTPSAPAVASTSTNTFIPSGGGGPGPAPGPAVLSPSREVPSGAIPGTTYTLAATPAANSLILTKNGVTQNPGIGNDYTLSGSTITMLSATIAGDSLLAYYWT